MAQEQHDVRIAYPALPDPLSPRDLVRLFTPTSSEISWTVDITTSAETQRGLLTLLKVFQTLGRFIAINKIPAKIVRHVSLSAGLPEVDQISYQRQTLYRHHALIREFVGVSTWNAEAYKLAENAIERLALARTHPADLVNGAIDTLIREHFELPALSTLRRITGKVQQRVQDRLLNDIEEKLSVQERTALDVLLDVPDGAHESTFAAICRPAGRATLKNLQKLIDHFHWLQSFLDAKTVLTGISPAKVEQWADEGRRLTAAELGRYRAPRRHAILLAVLCLARGRLLDDLVGMLVKIMRRLQHRAEAKLDAWHAERREASDRLVAVLRDMVGAYQTTAQPIAFQGAARTILDAAGGADKVMARCKDRLQHRSGGWRAFTEKGFRSQRAVLMNLAEILPLKAMPGMSNLLQALDLVVMCRSDRDAWIWAEIDTSFLDRQWRPLVCDADEANVYCRRQLEIAVFFELSDALTSSDVCVPGSRSYGAYTEHLFPIESEPQAVTNYLSARGLPNDGQEFTNSLRQWLQCAQFDLERSVSRDQWVTLNRDGKPILHRTAANRAPQSATKLEQKVLDRLPPRTILEALYNTDRWTGWSQRFGPPARIGPQLDKPSERYVLTSFAYGCGLGPVQASRHFKESVPAHSLRFANRRHMGTDALRAASSDLINFYASFELPSCWGTGESAAADGTLVQTYDDNLLATHHVRYGRTGGIAYRHVADNYIALFSHFIPCGMHEAVYILDGLIKNLSTVRPSRLHADTHGQSTAVFGLAYLLGIELMPRIRNWRALTLYRAERNMGCHGTAHLYGDVIDWDLIAEHWEDYLRVVLAIHSGRVSASWILARLNSYSRRNRLYLAFQELGRVVRTVYLIRWIETDELRSSVTGGANKVESFHNFSSHLRFGSGGVLRTNNPDEQEKAIVYNELVANAVMLQTMADQTQVLHDLHREGHDVDVEDLAYISPYVTRSLKRFGEYPVHHVAEPPPSTKQLP